MWEHSRCATNTTTQGVLANGPNLHKGNNSDSPMQHSLKPSKVVWILLNMHLSPCDHLYQDKRSMTPVNQFMPGKQTASYNERPPALIAYRFEQDSDAVLCLPSNCGIKGLGKSTKVACPQPSQYVILMSLFQMLKAWWTQRLATTKISMWLMVYSSKF